jgi:hypothetical protein
MIGADVGIAGRKLTGNADGVFNQHVTGLNSTTLKVCRYSIAR